MHNVTKCSGQWRNSGAVEAKKYLLWRGRGRMGAASAATAVAASGGVTASARTCNERTASLSRIPIEDVVFQSGYRHCGPETDMQCRITYCLSGSTARLPHASLHSTAAPLRFRQVRLHGACHHTGCAHSDSSHFFIVIWFHLIFSAKVRGERKQSSKKFVPTF